MTKNNLLKRGDIVAADFPFVEDPSKSKRRPALILWTDKPNELFVLAFMGTKQIEMKEEGDVIIRRKDPQFNITGLVRDSKIKLTRLSTQIRENIKKIYGSVPKNTIEEVNKEITNLFTR